MIKRAFQIASAISIVVGANAAALDGDYTAARRRAVQHLHLLSKDCRFSSDPRELRRFEDEDRRLRDELRRRLVGILGERPPAHFLGPPETNPPTLACGREHGGLDGLVYRASDRASMVLVTNSALLHAWLSDQKGWRRGDPSSDELIARGALYTLAFGANASVTPFYRFSLQLPVGVDGAAMLAEESQTRAVRPPQRLAIGLVRDGQIWLAMVSTAAPVTPVQACALRLARYQERARAASLNRDFRDAEKIMDQGEQAYVDCWGVEMARHPQREALTAQAQSLVDRLLADR
ncbi:MAG: hypothetical protein ACKOUS_03160 [Alphaproteobacteria bacterium]